MVEKEFKSRWRIVEMDQWGKEFIDLVKPGYIEFIDNSVVSLIGRTTFLHIS